MKVAFHSGSVSVVVATCLGIAFIFTPKWPVSASICGQAALKPSYVLRPSSSASASRRLPSCQVPSSSLKYGPLQDGLLEDAVERHVRHRDDLAHLNAPLCLPLGQLATR